MEMEFFEKILIFTCKNLNEKLSFYSFSLPSSRTFVILYTSGTDQNLGCRGGGPSCAGLGRVLSGLGGRGLYKSLFWCYDLRIVVF